MKRRIIYALMGLALIASLGFASPRSAGAEYYGDPCAELAWAVAYHLGQGNIDYVGQLIRWQHETGCLNLDTDTRLIA
jgi:hypothetical protein